MVFNKVFLQQRPYLPAADVTVEKLLPCGIPKRFTRLYGLPDFIEKLTGLDIFFSVEIFDDGLDFFPARFNTWINSRTFPGQG